MIPHKQYGIYERFIKRPLDCFLSTLALIILSPVMLVTAILVRIKLGSPIIFSQERPGKDEKLFKIYKFRTMADKKDENGNLLPDSERLTKFGKILRSTSLDELPELFNIAKGDMAIVGPRPLLTQYLPYYRPEERERHAIRPGLTGYAQIHGRNYLMWDERIAADVKYAKKITFIGDLSIIIQTVIKVIKRSDVAEKRIPPFDQVRREEAVRQGKEIK
jgi:lipopolysaccharide/colanic/teichoic acid biosynthesis glycosyltransferase